MAIHVPIRLRDASVQHKHRESHDRAGQVRCVANYGAARIHFLLIDPPVLVCLLVVYGKKTAAAREGRAPRISRGFEAAEGDSSGAPCLAVREEEANDLLL